MEEREACLSVFSKTKTLSLMPDLLKNNFIVPIPDGSEAICNVLFMKSDKLYINIYILLLSGRHALQVILLFVKQ